MGGALVGLLYLLFLALAAAFVWFVVPLGCIVLVVLAVAPLRRSSRGWKFVKIYFRALTLYGLACVPLILFGALVVLSDVSTAFYHYRLDAPRELDGIAFPANSEVQLSPIPPHHVSGGHLGAPTTIAGLRLVGDFAMSGGEVASGDLAEPHQIDRLSCGAGQFYRNSNGAGCMLAQATSIQGLRLAGGTWTWLAPSAGSAARPIVQGTLVEPAHVDPFDCGPGAIDAADATISCVLAADQDIDGYRLRGGTPAKIGRQDVHSLSDGVLARPLDVSGVVLPPGTRIDALPPGQADTMHDHSYIDYEAAVFETPTGATIAVHGGEVQGAMRITFDRSGIRLSADLVGSAQAPGIFALAGDQTSRAVFSYAEDRWHLCGAGTDCD